VIRRALICALGGGFAGCGLFSTPAPPPLPTVDSTPAAPREEADDAITMSGINLFIHDNAPTVEGVERKPLLWLHAEKYRMEGTVWWVEQARAVVYAHEEGGSDLTLEAARGRFDEGKGAYLESGVIARMADLTIEMQDVSCDILDDRAVGVARSANPVRVRGEDIELDAAGIELRPDKREVELTDVRGGFVRFGRNL
jgi:hypothetical protein